MKIIVTHNSSPVSDASLRLAAVHDVISSNFISVVRSARPALPTPLKPRMMQMAPLTALMIEDDILLRVKAAFTSRARLCPGNIVHVFT